MAKRQSIEAVDGTLQDIIGVTRPLGGNIMLMGVINEKLEHKLLTRAYVCRLFGL
jgi:hypothetical protein